jgi:acetate kinase
MSVLTINAGSSSIKSALFDDEAERAIASVVVEGAPEHAAESLEKALQSLRDRAPEEAEAIRAVGHRVVHGGTEFGGSIRLDDKAKDAIRRTARLAPLHNPPALAVLDAAQRRFPQVPHVAAFDTAFFATLDPRAYVYPLPYRWFTECGIRRFGFHGLSHAYCAGRAAEMLASHPVRHGAGADAGSGPGSGSGSGSMRVVILHLGNGCSASAVRDGQAIATTMGFTPLEGLMMGTRSGSVDPGILLHLMRENGLDPKALDRALQYESGLLGVSGVSGDYREVDRAAREGSERARLAIEIYADRARAAVGSLAVTLGGLDALVFTAGVGENARGLRELVCRGLGILGVHLDPTQNERQAPDADIATQDSPGRILVLRTREDLMLARETYRALHA